MFCEKCGNPLRDNARFCPACGQATTETVPPAQANVQQPAHIPQDAVPIPQDATPIPQDATPIPQYAIPVPQDATPVPQYATPVPQDATPIPQYAIPVPQDATPVPQYAIPVPQDATPVPQDATPIPQYAIPVPQDATPVPQGAALVPQAAAPMQEMQAPQKAKNKVAALLQKKWSVPVLAAMLVAVCVGGFLHFNNVRSEGDMEALMTSGGQYAADGNYGDAIDSYKDVLDKKPGDPDTIFKLAGVYLKQGLQSDAKAALGKLKLSSSDDAYAEYQRLLALAESQLTLTGVDASAFPTITVRLNYNGTGTLGSTNFNVSEGNTECRVIAAEGGDTFVSYVAGAAGESDEPRELLVTLTVDELSLSVNGRYITPHFEPAALTLTSTDVSQYPTVKAYFSVTNMATGEAVPGLDANSFIIRERLQGGQYLEREVKSAESLEGNEGLNIGLAIDKSDSISDVDMQKIKNVTTEFINNLHYSVGDKAEILAFDSIVQQMCHYTGDANLLSNGIRNMSTDGMTALYNAIYNAIDHAALQGGARCVIAFTDGMDNESSRTPNDIIAYSKAKQVPVYIIGVSSSVEVGTLSNIAQSTGGKYWFIDDLYDLQDIFDQIYSEQKKLYVVEYESDSASDPYAMRDINVTASGNGMRADVELTFTPNKSVHDTAVLQNQGSRYKLIKEALSWEEASQRCQEMGGHLATVTSQSEMDELVQMSEDEGANYVWLGGYTSYDNGTNVFGHWVTGENFDYQSWCKDEPSRIDQDGENEWYIMLWNIESLGGWTWNDQRNDPGSVLPGMRDEMAYICEFEI